MRKWPWQTHKYFNNSVVKKPLRCAVYAWFWRRTLRSTFSLLGSVGISRFHVYGTSTLVLCRMIPLHGQRECTAQRHAAGVHRVEGRKNIGVTHGNPHGAVATHEMSGIAAAPAIGAGTISGGRGGFAAISLDCA
ncbi:MAG: hypothetical protein P4L57_10970 [Rhizomicrobium sp.]|nr:hypothetical protein [Rhizomicrobium sp.]